ncbi:MAG: hypothetical protein JXR73_08575 [Candidatus Omnitrophica bacterium]|nr:hypothetical protein [Candidatus Omnitrophota bacterium]
MTMPLPHKRCAQWNCDDDLEPVRDWVSREFDFIPCAAVQSLYDTGRDIVKRLDMQQDSDLLYFFPVEQGTLYHPRDQALAKSIRTHLRTIAQCGFHLFESEHFGLLLWFEDAHPALFAQQWERLQEILYTIEL